MSSFVSFLKKVRGMQIPFIEKALPKADQPKVPILYSDSCKRKAALPRDVHYVTPRLLLMPFPTPELLYSLSSFLNTTFGKKYMIWNLSEKTYDNQPFGGQVIDYVFMGYPNPPLDMLFATCNSIQAWLATDPSNVAVIHCQATRSRSVMILSCFLAWTNPEIPSALQALIKVCGTVGLSENKLLFPSQKRYMQYSEIILSGELVLTMQPTPQKMTLQRVIITGIPVIESEGAAIRPYIQVFKGQKVVFSTGIDYYPSDLSMSFDINTEVEGDVLLRCRHLGRGNARQTLFRVMFHTSFVADGLLRLDKQDLDFGCEDERIPNDMMIDLFLAPVGEVNAESQNFWRSVEHRKQITQSPQRDPQQPATHSDSEEEKVDHALIAKYQKDLEESGEDEDDLTDYLSALESKSPTE